MDSSDLRRRYRVSDRLSGTLPAVFEGRLDKRFFPYFDYLLDSEHTPEEHSDFYDVYVSNPEFEEKLRRRVISPRSQITAITGARGIGKSTSIRFFFGASTQPKLMKMSSIMELPDASKDPFCIVIPFYLDTHNLTCENVERVLTSQIQSAAELISNSRDIALTEEDVYDFVHTHKSQLVTYTNLSLSASVADRMSEFRQNNTYGYVTELLKYVLHKGNIERVILVVDDIESSPYDVQKALVKGVLKLRDCLRNVGTLKRAYVPDYIFTCRPATFSLLVSDPEIDGFSVGYPIELKSPADLHEIVKKRFDYAVKVIGEGKSFANMGGLSEVKNLGSWREAYRVFEIVAQRLASMNQSLIVDLCNHDVRQSLIDLQETLRNSRWFERGTHEAGFFEVTESDFFYTTAGLIRAMVLRDQEYYSEELNSSVPNLFFNRENTEADLMLLHVVKFFFEKARSQRVVLIKKSEIRRALTKAYGPSIVSDNFEDVMNYVRASEIARFERVPDSIGRTDLFVIPMTKAFRLWRMCGQHSVFLEFFRDNTFLSHARVVEFPLARSRGTSRLPADQKFILSADFILEVAEAEEKILERVLELSNELSYRKLFGARSISRHLFLGLTSSVRRHYPKTEGRRSVPVEVSRAISEAGEKSQILAAKINSF